GQSGFLSRSRALVQLSGATPRSRTPAPSLEQWLQDPYRVAVLAWCLGRLKKEKPSRIEKRSAVARHAQNVDALRRGFYKPCRAPQFNLRLACVVLCPAGGRFGLFEESQGRRSFVGLGDYLESLSGHSILSPSAQIG